MGMGTHVLIDQDDADVLALGGEAVEGGLDGGGVGLAVHHEEVLLRVRRVRHVLLFSRPSPDPAPAARQLCLSGMSPSTE